MWRGVAFDIYAALTKVVTAVCYTRFDHEISVCIYIYVTDLVVLDGVVYKRVVSDCSHTRVLSGE